MSKEQKNEYEKQYQYQPPNIPPAPPLYQSLSKPTSSTSPLEKTPRISTAIELPPPSRGLPSRSVEHIRKAIRAIKRTIRATLYWVQVRSTEPSRPRVKTTTIRVNISMEIRAV